MHKKELFKIGHYVAWGVIGVFTAAGIVGVVGIASSLSWPIVATVATVIACVSVGAAVFALNKTPLSTKFGHFTQMIDNWFNKTFRGKKFYLKQVQPLIQKASAVNDENELIIRKNNDKIKELDARLGLLELDYDGSKSAEQKKAKALKILREIQTLENELKLLPLDKAEFTKITQQILSCVQSLDDVADKMAQLNNLGAYREKFNFRQISIDAKTHLKSHIESLSQDGYSCLTDLSHADGENSPDLNSIKNQLNKFKTKLSSIKIDKLVASSRENQQFVIDELLRKLKKLNEKVFPAEQITDVSGKKLFFKPSIEFIELRNSSVYWQLYNNLWQLEQSISAIRNPIESGFRKTKQNLLEAQQIFSAEEPEYPYNNSTDPFFFHYSNRNSQLKSQMRDDDNRVHNKLSGEFNRLIENIGILKNKVRSYLSAINNALLQTMPTVYVPQTDHSIAVEYEADPASITLEDNSYYKDGTTTFFPSARAAKNTLSASISNKSDIPLIRSASLGCGYEHELETRRRQEGLNEPQTTTGSQWPLIF